MSRFFLIATCLLCLLSTPFSFAATIKPIDTPFDKVWLIEDTNIPLITIAVALEGAGAATDPEAYQGRANMAAGLLDRGAGPLSATEFQEALAERAMQFSAYVDKDSLYITVRTLAEYKEKAFELLGYALSAPHFSNEQIAQAKTKQKAALARREESPSYRANVAMNRALYGSHPYGYSILGTQETIDNISKNWLDKYKESFFAAPALNITLVGDISADEAEVLIKQYITLPKRTTAPQDVVQVALPESGSTQMLDMPFEQSAIMFGLPGINVHEDGFYALMLANYALGGGGFESRMMKVIRDTHGLAYSASSYQLLQRQSAPLMGTIGTRYQDAGKSVELLKEIIAGMYQNGISAEELQLAKQYLIGAFPVSLSNQETLASYVRFMQTADLPIDFIDKRTGYIEAVTLEEANEVTRKILDPPKLHIVVVGRQPATEGKE